MVPQFRWWAGVCSEFPGQLSSIHQSSAFPDVTAWRRLALQADRQGKPIVFRQQLHQDETNGNITSPVFLPALRKWFGPTVPGKPTELSPSLARHLSHIVPYELAPSSADPLRKHALQHFLEWLRCSRDAAYKKLSTPLMDCILAAKLEQQAHVPAGQGSRGALDTPFIRFDAPLALLAAALHYNRETPDPSERVDQLYIAQMPLSELPGALQLDVPIPNALTADPTPEIPYTADIYISSLWLGLEPTFTPWHRDPNPNLFCQLVGSKTVRLMPPAPGKQLFAQVSAGLGQLNASHAIRGQEMMQPTERKAWWDAVWGPSVPKGMFEVVLRPRDVLFLPMGWWHSVRSILLRMDSL
ncbi:Clavaminate synthase-like protein [Parathielavia appendiculata]|uniref:Clavaminate synthase-like protein n=1 Tax=Parathielavia appendiculata TaxID=2587402 RepID=A0AAN6U5H9_9PEZI|nr:Clavaminate synthase-like protein [Parathielavia appendiculata]